MKAFASRAVAVSLVGALIGASSWGTSPPCTFQGLATDPAGHRLSGPLSLTLKYFDDPAAGNLLLSEAQTGVNAANGLFNTQLGTGTLTQGVESTLPAVFQKHDSVWIEITVNADPPMAPRIQVLAVPFAIRAATADAVAGLSPSTVLTTDATSQTKAGPLTVSATGAASTALTAKGDGTNTALQIDNGALKITGATPAAFVHTISAANTSGATTTLDNPLTNNDPSAMLIISRVGPLTSISASPESVSYNGTRWQINNTNAHPLLTGEQFNVLVIKTQ